MKKFLTLILASLFSLGGSTLAQQQRPPEPPPGGGPGDPPHRGERPPKGERPPRGPRPGGRPGRPGADNQPGGRQRPGGGGGGPRPGDLGESEAELGSSGIAWYPILEDGLAEAKRTNKPIFFMAVASQCGGISGVF